MHYKYHSIPHHTSQTPPPPTPTHTHSTHTHTNTHTQTHKRTHAYTRDTRHITSRTHKRQSRQSHARTHTHHHHCYPRHHHLNHIIIRALDWDTELKEDARAARVDHFLKRATFNCPQFHNVSSVVRISVFLADYLYLFKCVPLTALGW